jgi:chitin synthase
MGGEVANVPLRRWEDWERSRLRKMKRDERRRRDFERQFGSRQTYQSSNSLWDDSTAHSETASSYGGEEDRWGMEIGHYSEDGPTLAPPPIGLFHIDADSSEGDHETIAEHELELVLDQGWQEDDLGGRPYGSGYASSRPMSPQAPPTLYALSDAPIMQKTWSSNSHEPLNQSASSSVEQFAAQDPFNNTNYATGYGSASPIGSPIPSPYQQQHAQMLPAGAASSGFEGSGGYGHVKNRSLSSTNSSPVIARGGREASGGAETPSPTREHYGQGRRIA